MYNNLDLENQFFEKNFTLKNLSTGQEYIFIEQLGNGSEGIVYKGQVKNTNEIVAIKMQYGSIQMETIDKFQQVHFKHVVNVKDIILYNQYTFIVMDYADGEFYKYMKTDEYQNKTKVEKNQLFLQVLLIMMQIVKGVEEIHGLNLIHRDIKPENILFFRQQDGIILKLCDFGLLKKSTDLRKTPNIGTPYYWAPEMISDQQQTFYTNQVDIWALGMFWYEMIVGRPLLYCKLYIQKMINLIIFHLKNFHIINIILFINKINQLITQMKTQQAAQLLLEETLFQVDLRAEQLKSYLEKVTNTVNSHSNYLNNLQIQLNQVLKLQDYEAYMQRTAKSMSLRDSEFEQQVSFQLEKPLAENGSDLVENAVCMVINKERIFGQGMAYLYKRSKDWEAKLSKMEIDLMKRATKDELDKGLKDQKTKLSDQIDDINKKLSKKISDQERLNTQNQNQLQQSLNDMEKKTLWKISDCEKLLQQRINDKFVETSCQGVYDRVMRDIAKQKDEGIKGIQNEMAEMKAKAQYNDESNQEKFKTLRIQLKELNDTLTQKYTPLEKHEQNKQILSDRTIDLQNKVSELTRKMDAILQLEKLIPQIKQMDDRLADCQHRGELNRKDIEELKIKVENVDGSGKGVKSDIDPHKVCSLEADIKRLKSDYTDQENKLRMIENELKRKIDVNEQRFLQQLNLLKQAPQQEKLSKEDIVMIIDKDLSQPMSLLRARILQIVGMACGENMSFEMFIRNLLNDIAEIKKKMDALGELEKRMKKLMKSMSSNDNTDLQKQLAEKANDEDMKAKFAALEEKYKTMAENYGILAKGMKELEEFSNYLQTLLYVNQQETVSILTGNHRVVTQRCLVCSGKTKLTKTVDKSQDLNQAKLVRGELRPKDLVYENSEVYELNPNQVNYMQDTQKYVGTTVGFKYPLLNQNKSNEASQSSGRMLRPVSAQQRKQ